MWPLQANHTFTGYPSSVPHGRRAPLALVAGGNQCHQVIDAVGLGRDWNGRDAEFVHVLLKGEIAVDDDEHVELGLSERQTLTVGESAYPRAAAVETV